MVKRCEVCKRLYEAGNQKISFHRFPQDEKLLEIWKNIVGIEKLSKGAWICSLHFKSCDLKIAPGGLRRCLRKGAKPIVHVREEMSRQENKCDSYSSSTRISGYLSSSTETASETEQEMRSSVDFPKLVPKSDPSSVDHCFRENNPSITTKDKSSPISRDNNSTHKIKVITLEPMSKMSESSPRAVVAPKFASRSENFQDMFQRKIRHEILTDIARGRMQLQGSTDLKSSTRSLRHNSPKKNETELQKSPAKPPAEPNSSCKSSVISKQQSAIPRAALHQVFSTKTPLKGRSPLNIAKLPTSSTENTPKPVVTQPGLVLFSPTPAVVKNSSVKSPQNASKTSVISQNAPLTFVHLPQTLPNTINSVNPIISQNAPQTLVRLPQTLPNTNNPVNSFISQNASHTRVQLPQTLPNANNPVNPFISQNAPQTLVRLPHSLPNTNNPANPFISQNAHQTLVRLPQTLPNSNNPVNPFILQNTPQNLVHLPQTLSNASNPMNSIIIIPQGSGVNPNGLFLLPQNLQQNIILPPLTLLSSGQQTSQIVSASNSLQAGQHPSLSNSFTNITANKHVDSITCQLSSSSTDTASETSRLVHNSKTMEESFFNSSSKEKSRCRTCLDPVPNQLEQASISMICFEEKTVKEGLVQLLPEMNSTLSDDHFVCAKCFMLLRNTLKFMKKCLEAESVIAKDLKNYSEDVPENTLVEDGFDLMESYIDENISLGEDVDDNDEEENDSAFECDPNVEEQDYILNGITKLIRGREVLKSKDFNEKQSDLENAVIKHLNFLPLEHAKVHDHNSIVSIGKLEPDFIFSLQRNKIKLLQNCSKFDENIFKNKRVLLLGGHTEIKCLLCEEHFNTEASMQNHITDVHGLSKAFLMETYCYQYTPGSSNICEACGKDCGNGAVKKAHLKNCFVFPCPYCDELFTSGQLPNHTSAEHDDPKPFKCVRCKQEKVSFVQFKSHLCNALVCEICGKHFLDKNRFRIHTARCIESKDDRRKCPECKQRFDDESLFASHIKIHKFPCSICGKIFHSRSSLSQHEYNHRCLKRSALCPLCGKVVKSLKQHMRVHDDNRIKKAKCSQCPKSFFDEASLMKHISVYHKVTSIVCAKCGKLCNEGNIENHYDSQHPHETVFNCVQCEATFTRIAFLKQHAKSHASQSIEIEMDNKSKKPKRSRLPRCDIGFMNKYKIRIKAPGAPITCKYCLKTLKGLLHYKTHLETHLKLYRYKCRFCEMTYSNRANKNRHEKLHKDPNYKFRCGECWKIMSCQEELDSHMVCHADKPKKYQCAECSELFCREYQLRSHLINKHTQQEELEEARDEIIKDAFMDFAVDN